MGDPAQRRQRRELRALPCFHQRQSALAERRPDAPAGGINDVGRAARRGLGPRLFCQEPAAVVPRTIRARARVARAGRPRRRAGPGARRLAHRFFRSRSRSARHRDVRRPALRRRSQGAHEHAPLCGRRRRRAAQCQSRRRRRAGHREGAYRRHEEGRQCQGGARRRSVVGAPRPRLHLQPGAMAAAERPGGGGRRAHSLGAA